MIEKEIAKLEKPDHERSRSWLVPELGQMFLVVAELVGLDWLVRFGHLGTLSGAEPVGRRLDPLRIPS